MTVNVRLISQINCSKSNGIYSIICCVNRTIFKFLLHENRLQSLYKYNLLKWMKIMKDIDARKDSKGLVLFHIN